VSDDTEQLNVPFAGRYRIERELGRGGMATVYLAADLRHSRRVAIKVLDPELAAALGSERFLREIEVAAGLHHPHILPLYDSGSANGQLFYVMPYAEGESLRQRLQREKQLPLDDALRVTREVADALDYAHRRGVVHRDIKPENILLLEHHAVVADFGIARAVSAAGGETLTATGLVLGTPAYMSPEQVAGGRELDGRADQYALACVLYEMLAGQTPFTGPTAESLAHQHLNVAPRAVTDLRTSVPPSVSATIARALAKNAADRFGTAAQFSAALAGSPDTGRPERARFPGRPRVWAGVLTVILLALAAWMLKHYFLPDPAKKAWILVAEFDAPPADSLVAAATRDLVSAALDQSEIVATVPRDQIRQALLSAGKPASTRVDAELARELAYGSAVRNVLEGRLGRLGNGYSVVLRVIDADSAHVVASVSDAARNSDALIPTVGRIAQRLRAALGERRNALQSTNDFVLSATPSFEAYKEYVRGRDKLLAAENRAATRCTETLSPSIQTMRAPGWASDSLGAI
jgi:serine/threonine-protein kinase